MDSCTMIRLAEIHTCPALEKRPFTAPSAAFSISASGKTINGSDPPSSKTTFFKFFPACSANFDPAYSLPVSEPACTCLLATRAGITSCPMMTLLKRSSGKPAFRNASSIAKELPVTLRACLSTIPFPAMSGGIPTLSGCQNG